MAVVAFGIGCHMVGGLTGGSGAIVTTGAGTGNHRVIEIDLQPVTNTILHQVGEKGVVKGLVGNMREVVTNKPGQQSLGQEVIYNQDCL